MKKVGAALLALLCAVIFPLLIWVGLFIAIRPVLARAMRKVAGPVLALLAGVAAPLLIWVGLFVALKERYQEWQIQRSPSRTIGQLLHDAGISVQRVPYPEDPLVETVFAPRPMTEIHGMLARAGF
jgi:hypothetical protein